MLDGRLRTGDIGRLDEAGYLYVTDRAKDMIVSGGMNVYPAEVEAALAGLPGLAEVAVFGVPDERWGETVVAVAVVSDPALDEAAIIGAARERIASYKKPTRVRFARRAAPHGQPEDRQAGAAPAVGGRTPSSLGTRCRWRQDRGVGTVFRGGRGIRPLVRAA